MISLELLQQRILKDGKALSESILKVDVFLNHQVDPDLMQKIGIDFAEHFKDYGITRVLTIESSGIAPAVYTAQALGVPMVILKKQTSKILNGEVYQTNITSFTKGTSYELTLSKDYISSDDGIGILIEKSFQNGRKRLIDAGYEVYSQARVAKLGEGLIEFVDE